MIFKVLIFFIQFSFLCIHAKAQTYVYAGIHQNFVRTKRIQHTTPLQSFHIGAAINVYNKNDAKTFYTYDISFVEKGYNQTLDKNDFNLRFKYAATQVTVGYVVAPCIALKVGINWALLFHSNVYKWTKVYNPIDLGVVAGLNLFENKRIGLYMQAVHGILPMVMYYDIDPQGNFHGRLYDLRNTTVMVGIRIDVYAKKIKV